LRKLDDTVPRKLSEILTTHGQSSLTDARLCENLLKDYCGEYKEEIALLVLGVKERIAIDLLVSQEAVEPEVLRSLLATRLRRSNSLSESDALWIIDSWSHAVATLNRNNQNTIGTSAAVMVAEPPAGDLQTAIIQWTFGLVHQSNCPVGSVAFSRLDDTIAFGSDDGCIRLLARTGLTRLVEQCPGRVSCVRVSPNGVLLAVVCEEANKSRVRVWDLQSSESLDLGYVGNRAPSLTFSPGGTRLACGSAERDGIIRVWNLQSGQTQTLKGDWSGPTSISFSPDSKVIAAGDAALSDGAIRLWNLDTGTAETLGHCQRQIGSVAFSPDGASVASGSWDETVRLWDVRTRKATVLANDCSCVSRVVFSALGDKIAACSLDSKIRVWQLPSKEFRAVGYCDRVNDMAFSSDGRALATASADGTIRLWDAG